MGGTISLTLAQEGAHVTIAGRDKEELEAHADRIRAVAHGRAVLAVPTDVTDENEVQAMVAAAVKRFERVDVLVNAHGVIGPVETPMHRITAEDWRFVLEANLFGTFLCCKTVVPHMIRQRYGKIINIGGTSGLRGYRNRAAYSSSKWAVRGLTRTLALEVGPHNVNVNVLIPGVVEGDRMTTIVREKARVQGRDPETVYQTYVGEMALRRFSTPNDIADAALFLASDESRQITGQEIVVDGGWDV